jgi:hypothetical protein
MVQQVGLQMNLVQQRKDVICIQGNQGRITSHTYTHTQYREFFVFSQQKLLHAHASVSGLCHPHCVCENLGNVGGQTQLVTEV